MAFYEEFTNLTTGTQVIAAQEFSDAEVGTQFERVDGSVYIKNSQGYFQVEGSTVADDAINSDKFANVQSLQIIDSAGTVVKTIYGAGE